MNGVGRNAKTIETKGTRLSNNKLEEILFLFVLYTITHQPAIIKEYIIILLL